MSYTFHILSNGSVITDADLNDLRNNEDDNSLKEICNA